MAVIPRIYTPLSLETGMTVALDERAAAHIRVLRLKLGFSLYLFDGKGSEYKATLIKINKKQAQIYLSDRIDRKTESSLTITLAQGISRGDHMDFALQKAVELGVNRIIPLITEYSNFSQDRAEKRLAHWQGIITSACEQCGRNYLPTLENPQLFTDLLKATYYNEELKILLDPSANCTLKNLSLPIINKLITVLIGPEGGLSATEIRQAQKSGFIGVQLGPRILRTETATAAILANLQLLWGDF
ncbi:16S rRNA (uracil(1498)-N(3))-methyltransferase [Candidatus Nitrosacidococcus tergens]|uniref:Ribosomal RNA small subunit methyltransferase E n=1 Tax=Candidatus Nitrosacidococcus tergens TaxID=553981 RepID=A0A7G1QAP8_9GAMM|nr:16S rRNA (uracil(1498)-N(3))-methyltransferase [Candidatus Nitrosacidococcus tergens]CAB1276829.1 Ribosomal RNA small subunit methyltransferase E [Candidatus Nitrosacidococcus tergens]